MQKHWHNHGSPYSKGYQAARAGAGPECPYREGQSAVDWRTGYSDCCAHFGRPAPFPLIGERLVTAGAQIGALVDGVALEMRRTRKSVERTQARIDAIMARDSELRIKRQVQA